jgi:thiol-disulfide isomerase/thioredoxin
MCSLIFGGSWCGPCRAESPELVRLYNTYKGKKLKSGATFQVVGVGIERDAKRWKRAIQQDGLNWPYHVLDQAQNLRFFDSPIASQFGVKQVPTKYLLNPEGEIALVNPSFTALTQILEEQLE